MRLNDDESLTEELADDTKDKAEQISGGLDFVGSLTQENKPGQFRRT